MSRPSAAEKRKRASAMSRYMWMWAFGYIAKQVHATATIMIKVFLQQLTAPMGYIKDI
jgi:hypothetical protein